MKIIKYFLSALIFISLYSCQEQLTDINEKNIVKIFGNIYEERQGLNIALKDVEVKLTGGGINMSDTTGIDGYYYFEFSLDTSKNINVALSLKKEGYRVVTPLLFTVTGGNNYPVTPFVMAVDTSTTIGGGGTPTSGLPQTIAYLGPATIDLKVYGVGGLESAIVTYEVRDSLGFPISVSKKDTVFFSLEGPPVAGGAYILPASVITNAAGRAVTTINSGTIAGVLQVVATLRRESDGQLLKSTPTKVVVHAGLPNQAHFSISASKYNFPGYNWVGRENKILVQAGDKYSNPVQTGTAVYLNTTGGIITAAGYTSSTGHVNATLYSGNPLPNAPIYGPGYAWVKAQTLGQNAVLVKDSTLILFSGISRITISPDSINVPRGGRQLFNVNISDQNGNPLSSGTTITSSIEFTPPPNTEWSALINGLPTQPFDDYLFRGPGKTDFILEVIDATANGGTPAKMPVVVKIIVTESNGTVSKFLSGYVGNF